MNDKFNIEQRRLIFFFSGMAVLCLIGVCVMSIMGASVTSFHLIDLEIGWGGKVWDALWIAGAYLMPLDEGTMIAGSPTTQFSAGTDFTIDNLDRNKGVFPYNAGSSTHYNNIGAVGQLPTLTPEVENWLYFSLGQTFGTGEVLITDPAVVSVEYRPRGIFLRGSNP